MEIQEKNPPLVVRFGAASNEIYTFRYFADRRMASVMYPNGTTSQTEQRDVSNHDSFGDYICAIIGERLVDTLSVFRHLYRKNLKMGFTDFQIDSGYLTASTISKDEQIQYRRIAAELDAQHFRRKKLHLDLGEFEGLIAIRYRNDIETKLYQLREFVERV